MKNRKKWAAAILLFVLGLVLAFFGFAGAGFSFENLGAQKIIENTLMPEGEFEDISVVVIASDVLIAPSSDGATRIVCRETEKVKHYAHVSDNTLTIDAVDTREWFDRIGLNFNKTSVTVYLPENEYKNAFIKTTAGAITLSRNFSFANLRAQTTTGAVKAYSDASESLLLSVTTGSIDIKGVKTLKADVKTTTGSITAQDFAVSGDMTATVTTGKIALSDVSAGSLSAKSTTGKLHLTGVDVSGDLTLETTTGDIDFEKTDAENAYLKTTTGDIRGEFLTKKQFSAKTSTGSVRVPDTNSGGVCRAQSATGDIEIGIQE